MKNKGIIFSAPMVRALLDGRKTQTRRLLRLPPAPDHLGEWQSSTVGGPGVLDGNGNETPEYPCVWHTRSGSVVVPSYTIGDRLYVREAWSVRGVFTDVVEVGYRASENRGHTEYVEQWPVATAVPGKAKPGRPAPKWPEWPKYGPSIHMPRWASRLWLSVTDVRVQRLQECSEAAAKAEGIEGFACIGGQAWRHYGGGSGFNKTDPNSPAKRSYSTLWDTLHTAEGERWRDNPWIVAVSFDVHRGNIDAEPQV